MHQLADFGLHPCLAECGEILARIPIQQQFIMYQLVGGSALDSLLRKLILGDGLRNEPGASHFTGRLGPIAVSAMQHVDVSFCEVAALSGRPVTRCAEALSTAYYTKFTVSEK
jgi:hypothetical protein